jgi:hypothetical protein
MQEAARHLLVCMPTDLKGLVDLLLYMEKNFSVLPQEITHAAGVDQSLYLLPRKLRGAVGLVSISRHLNAQRILLERISQPQRSGSSPRRDVTM